MSGINQESNGQLMHGVRCVCVHIHKYKYVLCTLCIIPDINEYCTVRTIDYDRQCGVVSGDL